MTSVITDRGQAPEPHAITARLVKKFALLVDLGIITVPTGYDHTIQLAWFREQHPDAKRGSLYYMNDLITDANFPNPTRILKPGDKLHVRAFKQVVGGKTTSEERMAFLATQKDVHTGAQGASVVFDQKRGQLPKEYWYVSLDEMERLMTVAGNLHRATFLDCDRNGTYRFGLNFFEDDCSDRHAFLSFNEVEDLSWGRPLC